MYRSMSSCKLCVYIVYFLHLLVLNPQDVEGIELFSSNKFFAYLTNKVESGSPCGSQPACYLDLISRIHTFRGEYQDLTLKTIATAPKLKLPDDQLQTVMMILNKTGPEQTSVPEKIVQAGYPVESHKILTEDGYILTYFRIPFGKNETRPLGTKIPVLIHHGLFGHSGFWTAHDQEKNFPYMLADLGYDVWLANCRGTLVSQVHISHPTDSPEFWNFSYDEIGRYDLPAAIDYILAKTVRKKLVYVGHSMGTSVFFVAMSERPEYNRKIHLMVALAPVAYVHNAKSLATMMAPMGLIPMVHQQYYALKVNEAGDLFRKFAYFLCDANSPTVDICASLYFLMYGFSYNQTDFLRLAKFLNEGFNPTSIKISQHFAQGFIWKDFLQMNEGVTKNCKRYGTCTPPRYDITKITTKTALFYADNDQLASTTDVKRLCVELPNVLTCSEVDFPDWNHMDFVMARDVNDLLFYKVVDFIREHSLD